jgi:N-acetylmuramoyl-L-alanine amidase
MSIHFAERQTPNAKRYFQMKILPGVFVLILALLAQLICPTTPVFSAPAEQNLETHYNQLRQSFLALEKSPQKTMRQQWQPIIQGFKEIYKQYPQTLWGEKSMFMVGRIHYILFQGDGSEADLDQTLDHFSRLVNNYPQSPLADDALFLSAEIYFFYKKDPVLARQAAQNVIKLYPKGDMRKRAEDLLAQIDKGLLPAEPPKPGPAKGEEAAEEVTTVTEEKTPVKGMARVIGMRHWSTPQYTRIVVDVEDRISFRQKLLKKDPAIEKPERLYLDLYPARLAMTESSPLTIQDGLLRRARIGQYNATTVRLVLDIQSIKGYKVFFLENPYRLIVDVTGKEKPAEPPLPEGPGREKKLSLAQQLGLGVKQIVIDAGHGGKDKGAIGKSQVYEKNLTLKIARKLSQRLRQDLDIQTVLTRDSDHYIPLEERTAIANTKHADLFISIHINASPNPHAEGIETYFLNLATDEESIRVAAFENATSTKRISDMQKILKDLMLNTKIDESNRLAAQVQQNLVQALNVKFPTVKNLGVKQAPFYVLIGAQMPAILVEISFISNDKERDRLCQEEYLDQVVDGLVKGIDRYIKDIKLAGTPNPVENR